jgi:hypothetical protein
MKRNPIARERVLLRASAMFVALIETCFWASMESIQAMEPGIDANGNSIGPPPSPLELPFGSKKPFSLAAVTESGSDQTEASSDDAQADQLAKQLSNPVASLISVPFQANEDFGWSLAQRL